MAADKIARLENWAHPTRSFSAMTYADVLALRNSLLALDLLDGTPLTKHRIAQAEKVRSYRVAVEEVLRSRTLTHNRGEDRFPAHRPSEWLRQHIDQYIAEHPFYKGYIEHDGGLVELRPRFERPTPYARPCARCTGYMKYTVVRVFLRVADENCDQVTICQRCWDLEVLL